MGDFFVPNPDTGAPPPEPDIPPPDFEQVGKGVGSGLIATDWAGRFWLRFRDASISILSFIIAFLIKGAAPLIVLVMRTLDETDAKTKDAYSQVISATLEHIFGVEINPADVSGRGQRDRRTVVARDIGQAILGSLISPGPTTGAGGLQPDSSASEKYLETVVHLGIEGWLEAWIADAFSYHELEKFGDLKDIMAEMLGLGRLTRRVLAPPLKILVEDPYTWKLNDVYRPTLLTHDVACRQFLRGAIQRDELDQILGWQGFSPRNIDYLININSKFLALADLDYQIQRGLMTQLDAVQYLQDQGWKRDAATVQIALLHDKRIDVYRKDLILAAEGAYIRKDIEPEQFEAIIVQSGLPDEEQHWLLRVAAMKREMQFKHLTLSEIEALIRAGIMNVDDLRQWMLRENYSFEDSQFLELLLIDQVQTKEAAAKAKADKAAKAKAAAQAKAKAAADKQAAIDKQAADKGITRQQAAQLVKDGQWTFPQYSAYLASHGVGPDAIAQLTDLLHLQIDTTEAAQAKRDAAKAAAAEKEIPLSQAEAAVQNGAISLAEFRDFLVKQNYGPDDIESIVALITEKLQAAKLKANAKANATTKAKQHAVDLPAIETAVRLGLATLDDYKAALQAAAQDPVAIGVLVSALQDQMAADTAAAATRARVLAQAGAAGQGIIDLEAAVISGVQSIAQYQGLLARIGLAQADIDALTSLLQLRVDHAAAVLATGASAQAKAAASGLSLAEIQRATKLGVLSLDQYTAQLAKFNLTANDVAILRASMIAELQNTAAANKTRASAGKKLAKKGLSIAQMEQAVINGLQTVDQFTTAVEAEGISAADAATLGALAQIKADQAKAAEAKRAIAEARAADKDPPLAKEEALVTAGIVSMEDYGAYLAELGMDPLEIADLQALLSDKIAKANTAAAAKAAKASAPKKGTAPTV